MTINKREFMVRAQLEDKTLEAWIREEWLIPAEAAGEITFSDADVARVQLIRDLINDLGVNDRGGDEGGVIEGPFGATPWTSGYVTVTSPATCTANKGWLVTRKALAGSTGFAVGTAWENTAITIGGQSLTVAKVPTTATILYVGGYASGACVGPPPPSSPTLGEFYIINAGGSPAASGAGTLNRHR